MVKPRDMCVFVELFLKGKKIMRSKKGFTLIELMVVIIIVAVLAAVVVPMLISRIEKAKYSEGKAIASQVATAVRAYAAEHADDATFNPAPALVGDLGFKAAELSGKYFTQTTSNPTVSGVAVNTDGTLDYIITIQPNSTSKLTQTITMTCDNNVTTITPAGI